MIRSVLFASLCAVSLTRVAHAQSSAPASEAAAPSAPSAEAGSAAAAPGTSTEDTSAAVDEPGRPAITPATPPTNTAPPSAAPAKAEPTGDEKTAAGASDAELDAEMARYLDEENLNSSGSEQAGVELYGFADFSYSQFLIPSDSPWRLLYNSQGTFAVGNLNVYFDAQIAPTVRSLIEVRFTYMPNGSVTTLGPPSVRADYSWSDYTRNERNITLGGIRIERAYLEWEAHPLARIRVGQWLTPYGIWNVDHGSPVIVPTSRPFIIDEFLFPESQTGLLLEGRLDVTGKFAVEYGVGISNGRGPIDTYFDYDSNRGVTGRLKTTYTGKGTLETGVSAYTGQYTSAQTNLTISGDDISSFDEINVQYDEFSLGADVRYTLGGFLAQSEFMLNERRFSNEGRPPGNSADTLAPDDMRWGVYGLMGYRFDWFGVMPYVIAEYAPVPNTSVYEIPREAVLLGAGVNVRPIGAVVVKLGFDHVLFPEQRPATFDTHPITRLQAQVAWAF